MTRAIEFKGYAPGQGQLLPGFAGDALEAGDPVFFVDEVVEELDLGAFEKRYEVMGEHAYPPRLLLKLWLFGAIAGVYSGREIARRVHWDLRFRYLAGELRPDFRTVNRFRVRHGTEFAAVFRESVRIAQRAGLAKLGRVALDGTKLRANTSRSKAMSHGRMVAAEAQLEDEIAQILVQIEERNRHEDETEGDGPGGGGLPEELQLRERRRARIRAARAQLEAEKGEKLVSRHQKSFADPEANMMKTGEAALTYCYNAQAATSEDGIIVATGLSTSASDTPQLLPMITAVERNTGQRPVWVLADAGYRSEENFAALGERQQRALIALGREGKKGNWPKGRLSRRMKRTLWLPWARDRYGHRKTQAERPFAEIKQRMGLRRFALRGKQKVEAEWNLACAAFNLKAIWRAQLA
jgi:transposase